jgi:hypothetical protein
MRRGVKDRDQILQRSSEGRSEKRVKLLREGDVVGRSGRSRVGAISSADGGGIMGGGGKT